MSTRPDFIRHWTDLEGGDDEHYPGDTERLSIRAPLARRFGLTRIAVHHDRLLPGRRTSYPHAEGGEEEFIFVLEGTPDAWIDGRLHRLSPGDAVGFPAGTGISHTFLNNTREEVRLLVVGEPSKSENKVYYPLHPEHQRSRSDGWNDPPARELGGHDGKARIPDDGAGL